jgi:hypothetical protein
MPRKKRTKTINPVDDGTKQHSIKEYWNKEPTKIVLKPVKPKIVLKKADETWLSNLNAFKHHGRLKYTVFLLLILKIFK